MRCGRDRISPVGPEDRAQRARGPDAEYDPIRSLEIRVARMGGFVEVVANGHKRRGARVALTHHTTIRPLAFCTEWYVVDYEAPPPSRIDPAH